MYGRRSTNPFIEPLDLEIERTQRSIRDIFHPQRSPNDFTAIPLDFDSTSPVNLFSNPLFNSSTSLPNSSVPIYTPEMENGFLPPKALREHYTPSNFINPSPIRLPEVTAGQYEIKAHVLNMAPKFHGLPNENPYTHLSELLAVRSTFKIQHISDDAIMLRLFPFTLKDKAKEWFDALPANSIDNWTQMENAFLYKYFPPGKTNNARKAITTFKHRDNEKFHESWDRFNSLLRECPHHKIDRWQLVQSFYDSLDDKFKQLVDASCGGAIMLKSEDEAWKLFDLLAENSLLQTPNVRDVPTQEPKKGGIYEVSPSVDLTAKMDAMCRQMTQLMALNLQQQQAMQVQPPSPNPSVVCNVCFIGGHLSEQCPNVTGIFDMGVDQVNAVNPNNDPFSNSYNPGWKNHPNLSWGPKGQTQASYQQASQSSYQQPSFQAPQRPPFQGHNNNFHAPQTNFSAPQRPPFSNNSSNN